MGPSNKHGTVVSHSLGSDRSLNLDISFLKKRRKESGVVHDMLFKKQNMHMYSL